MSRIVKLTYFLLTLFYIQHASAQVHDFDSLVNNNDSFRTVAKNIGDTLDLFNETKPLEVVFYSDFKNLVKNKNKEEYQDATFSVMFNDTVQVTREIKIRPRGNMRKGACFMPPLKLNFPKKDAYIKQLELFDKLKMVLDCKRSDLYEQYLLSEYYTYKILNIITDYSLRVRLLKVTYIDRSVRFKDITRYAFIIESIEQLNARLNTIQIETKNIRDIRTNHKVLAEGYLFQYLIGNTDWSIPALHNVYLIKSNDPTKPAPYVIPYDFDYAGIINTNYAIPDENLGTKSVRERVYRGVCLTVNELQNARQLVQDKKQQILDLYEHDIYLTKYYKNSSIAYINQFFDIIENDNAFRREIELACR
jgi:hypothetical protein